MFPSQNQNEPDSGMNHFSQTNPSPFGLFLKVVLVVGAIVLVYNLVVSNDEPDQAQAQTASQQQQQAAGGGEAESGAFDVLGDIVGSTLNNDQQGAEQAQSDPSFYSPVIVDDGIEGSFFKLSYQALISEDGETVGQVNDMLVDPVSGNAAVIIYSLSDEEDMANPVLYRVGYERVMARENNGDFRIDLDQNRLLNSPEFTYTPQVFSQFISLKYLREGRLIDSYDEVVGNITEVTFRNNQADQIIFELDETLAPGQTGSFSMPFGNANLVHEQDGYNLYLTEQQTAALATQVFAKEELQEEEDEDAE